MNLNPRSNRLILESSLSPEQRQGRKSTPVVAYAGGGAFGAYAPYTPSTETESPQKKVDQGDWGNQSSLWSSWFDFSEDQNAEVGKSGVEKGTTRDGEAFESPVVAAQPPSGGAGDIQETVAMGTKVNARGGKSVGTWEPCSQKIFGFAENFTKSSTKCFTKCFTKNKTKFPRKSFRKFFRKLKSLIRKRMSTVNKLVKEIQV
jgi:hypothetical protein